MTGFKEFAVRYSKSRLGIVGLGLLLFFIAMATLAPILTPYDPQYTMQLANFRAKPEWLDAALPRNTYYIKDPGFTTSNALEEWNIVTTGMLINWSSQQGNPGIAFVEVGSGPGSVEFESKNPEGVEIASIEKIFEYTYTPPRRFSVHIAYKAVTEGEVIWNTQVYLKQTTGKELLLWESGEQGGSLDWTFPSPQIDSNNAAIRIRLFKDILADASKMIPVKGEYALIFRVTSNDNGGKVKVYVDDFSVRVWGETFGYLGTDNYGRDIYTQLVYGSRISIAIGILSAVIAVVLGVVVGLTSGYVGGWVDELLMRFNDVLLTIPGLPLMIVLTAVIGPSIISVIILIGFLGWMGIARLIRSQILSLKSKAFVEAARATGGGTGHIIMKHLVPNVITMAYTQLALTVPGAIVTEAALSFIGLGDPFLQTWGKMLHDVQYYGAISEWWWAVPPGICIALLSMAFVFIGYAMDDILNPQLRRR